MAHRYYRHVDEDGSRRGLIRRLEGHPLLLEILGPDGNWALDTNLIVKFTGAGGDCYDFVEISEDEARRLEVDLG